MSQTNTTSETTETLADTVVEVAEQHLGFAARRYLDRQCRLHLHKPLEHLEQQDLDELITWINNTAPLIMDKKEVQHLVDDLSALKDE